MSQIFLEELVPVTSARPVCVDLDGTLVKSDTLIDSLLLLVRTYPLRSLQAPLWLKGGKAAHKARIGSHVQLDPEHLLLWLLLQSLRSHPDFPRLRSLPWL